MRLLILLLLFINLFNVGLTKAQSYVADTLTAKFTDDTVLRFKHTLSVTDLRDENPNFISIYEKKKWLFFPIDQIVFTSRPLAKSFEYHLNGKNGQPYHLDIYEFYINHSKDMFNHSFSLHGAFQLFKIQPNGDSILMGAFYYEDFFKHKSKENVEKAYSKVINNFKTEFIQDLNTVCSDTTKTINPGQYHFRKGSKVAAKNFYISTDAYYGYTFWGFDAEIWFSSPEPAQKFKRKSRMFRYLNYKNRQSVAFSTGVSYLNYRVNKNWLLQNKSAFLLGFNKWNDIDEAKRTIEEVFLFQYSMTQRITLNRLDKSGIAFGVGLIEEASYIIYNKPIFSVGLVLNCAYKF